MNRPLAHIGVLLLTVASANAAWVILNHPTRGLWTNAVPEGIAVISVLPRSDSKNPDLRDYLLAGGPLSDRYPALVDTETGEVIAPLTDLASATNVAATRAQERLPARYKLKQALAGRSIRAALADAISGINTAATWTIGRKALADYADLIERIRRSDAEAARKDEP